MGGAVAVVGEGHALAGGALARGGAAPRGVAADGGVTLVRVQGHIRLGVLDVARDDLIEVGLSGHGEVAADVGEEGAFGAGEGGGGDGEPGGGGLPGAAHRGRGGGEEGAFGAGEVVAVDGEPGDDGLAGAQHRGVVGAGGLTGSGRQDLRGELAVDGSAELVHGYSWPSFSVGANPPVLGDSASLRFL